MECDYIVNTGKNKQRKKLLYIIIVNIEKYHIMNNKTNSKLYGQRR